MEYGKGRDFRWKREKERGKEKERGEVCIPRAQFRGRMLSRASFAKEEADIKCCAGTPRPIYPLMPPLECIFKN